jgi:sulfur carrier protein ThiS
MGPMRVTILPDRRIEEMEPATVAEVLRRLGLHLDAYLVVRDEEILTCDVRLKAEDAVDVIPVISGGSTSPPRPSGPDLPACGEVDRH